MGCLGRLYRNIFLLTGFREIRILLLLLSIPISRRKQTIDRAQKIHALALEVAKMAVTLPKTPTKTLQAHVRRTFFNSRCNHQSGWHRR